VYRCSIFLARSIDVQVVMMSCIAQFLRSFFVAIANSSCLKKIEINNYLTPRIVKYDVQVHTYFSAFYKMTGVATLLQLKSKGILIAPQQTWGTCHLPEYRSRCFQGPTGLPFRSHNTTILDLEYHPSESTANCLGPVLETLDRRL